MPPPLPGHSSSGSPQLHLPAHPTYILHSTLQLGLSHAATAPSPSSAHLQANLAKIAAHNARNDASFTLGLNGHADLTAEEFKLRYFGAQ